VIVPLILHPMCPAGRSPNDEFQGDPPAHTCRQNVRVSSPRPRPRFGMQARPVSDGPKCGPPLSRFTRWPAARVRKDREFCLPPTASTQSGRSIKSSRRARRSHGQRMRAHGSPPILLHVPRLTGGPPLAPPDDELDRIDRSDEVFATPIAIRHFPRGKPAPKSSENSC
jgi:hypothetical protein